MDRFVNLNLLNLPNFLLVGFSLTLFILLSHLLVSASNNQGNN